jgi:hypothetical protein
LTVRERPGRYFPVAVESAESRRANARRSVSSAAANGASLFTTSPIGQVTDGSVVDPVAIGRGEVATVEEDEALADVLEDDEEPPPGWAPVEELDDAPDEELDDELDEELPPELLPEG